MNSEVKYWMHIILTGKTIEPITLKEQANYALALYFLNCQSHEKKKTA